MGFFDFFKRLFGRGAKGGDKAFASGKALIVAVNDYPTAPLRGCVDDASNFQLLWTDTFGIDPSCVRMLLNKDATAANVKDAMRWLADVKEGQFALNHFSGHGVQVPGGESDGLTECICPYDFDWSPGKMITDDDCFKTFWEMPDNVRFYWTSDSCHSGDLNRDMTPPFVKKRSMPIPSHMLSIIARLKARRPMLRPLLTLRHAKELDVGFVSACQSNQTASDTVINGRPCGAFSHYFCEQVRKDRARSLENVLAQTARALKDNGYSQVPQGEGPAATANDKKVTAERGQLIGAIIKGARYDEKGKRK